MEGFRQRHQGDDSPLVVRELLAIGPSSDHTEKMPGPTAYLDLMVQGAQSDQHAESRFNSAGPPTAESRVQLLHGKLPARAAWLSNHRNPTRKWRFSASKTANSISESQGY